VDATRPQRKRTTEKHLEKRSGEGHVDSRLQVQLEEDGRRQHKTELGGDEWSAASDTLGVARYKL